MHPDISRNIWVNIKEWWGMGGIDDDLNRFVDDVHGYNFLDGNTNVMDHSGHGTHVAGIIAAVRDNGVGVAGVAPEGSAAIMPLKFLNEKTMGPISMVMPALRYARMNGATIVTNSWGAKEGISSKVIQQSLRQAILDSSGMLLIFAAGNEKMNISEEFHFPPSLSHDWALTIAASDTTGNIAEFSNYGGSNVHFAAPGGDISSLWPHALYKTLSGTSMAVPVVAGVAVAVLKRRPLLSIQGLKQVLVDSSTPTTYDITMGVSYENKPKMTITGGRLNMTRAVELSERYFVGLPNKEYHINIHSPSIKGFTQIIHNGSGMKGGGGGGGVLSYTLTVAIDTRGMPPGNYHLTLYFSQELKSKGKNKCRNKNYEAKLPIRLKVTDT
eukprot:GHVR01155860.1.p1 GENE.GHVR01155860.1~~GHVR01155860.1.p1  ORF type:complete len:384 (-),score=89.94 GHVR01155860.1:56-1207(-)